MNIHGWDLSLNCAGVARPDGTSRVYKHPGLDGWRRIAWLRGLLAQEAQGADVIVIEGYSFASNGNAFLELAQLGGVIRFMLWDAGIPFVEIAPPSLKKYATGNGRAEKPDMIKAACYALGYRGNIHDEADALWLREMGMDWYKVRPVPCVDERNREGLLKAKWPHITTAPRVLQAAHDF